MSPTPPILLTAITALGMELPAPVIAQVARAIHSAPSGAWTTVLNRAQQTVGTPHARNVLARLIATWRLRSPQQPPPRCKRSSV